MSYVYLIRSKESPSLLPVYKIGIANDVENRLAQLQTGNPNELVIESCYEFPNAQAVETALHQRFSKERIRNEWFQLTNADVEDFEKICTLLGGRPFVPESETSSSDDVDEAEHIALYTESGEWDYKAMFAYGWRIEPTTSRGKNGVYWAWRISDGGKRPYIYGGKIADLPYPIDVMRRVYRDGLELDVVAEVKE